MIVVTGTAGAASVEILKLYELKGKLTSPWYQALMRCPQFWLVAAGMRPKNLRLRPRFLAQQ